MAGTVEAAIHILFNNYRRVGLLKNIFYFIHKFLIDIIRFWLKLTFHFASTKKIENLPQTFILFPQGPCLIFEIFRRVDTRFKIPSWIFLLKGRIRAFIFLNETSCVFSGGYRRLSSKPCKGETEDGKAPIQYSSHRECGLQRLQMTLTHWQRKFRCFAASFLESHGNTS